MNTQQSTTQNQTTQLVNGVDKTATQPGGSEYEQLKAQLAKLQAELAEQKAAKTQSLSLKVSDKGAISLYGMGRFPVTLYPEQWASVLAIGDKITKFAADNKAELDKRSAFAKTDEGKLAIAKLQAEKLAKSKTEENTGGTRVDVTTGKKES